MAKVAFLMTLVSCGEYECLEANTPIQFDELVIYDEGLFCFLKGSNNNHVIRSQSEYDELVGCSKTQNIDFNNQTVLARAMRIPTNGRVSHQSVERDRKNKIIFRVNIQEGNGQAFSTVYFFAVIPKIKSGTRVIFDVRYIE